MKWKDPSCIGSVMETATNPFCFVRDLSVSISRKIPVAFKAPLATILEWISGSIQSNYWPVFKKMDQSKFTLIGIDPEGYGKSRPPDRNAFAKEFCLKRDARLAAQVMQVVHRFRI